jgi:dihydroflavonol-4-reductase
VQKYSFLSVFLSINSKNEKMILVTGATGLVGGHLLWHLLQENERVSAIRRPTSNLIPLRTIFSFYCSNPDDFLQRIDWKTADVLDFYSLVEAMNAIDIVYHCAAVVSLGNSESILLDTNVTGTRNVVQAAVEKNIKKFCFVSSIAACGKTKYSEIIDENAVWTDSKVYSLYSKSKYYSEQEVWKGIKNGLNAVIVNPGVILGVSGQNTGSSQLFYQVQKGLIFYTNGGSGYVDVQDVVKAMIQLVKSKISGERFVLVGENSSNKDVLSWMADSFGKRRPFICIGKRMMLSIGYLSEIIGKLFNFSPMIDLGTAKSAINREFYSSHKIEKALGFEFNPIEKCIKEVCDFQK